MADILVVLQIIVLILMVYVLMNSNKPQKNRTIVIDRENKKELDKLSKLRAINLSEPLTDLILNML